MGIGKKYNMFPQEDISKLYQRIGEYVVCFQWTENLIRQIGYQILCNSGRISIYERLIKKKNEDLVNEVIDYYLDLIDRLQPFDHVNRKENVEKLRMSCHEVRKFRNRFLHSAFIELKAGGDVIGLMREIGRAHV